MFNPVAKVRSNESFTSETSRASKKPSFFSRLFSLKSRAYEALNEPHTLDTHQTSQTSFSFEDHIMSSKGDKERLVQQILSNDYPTHKIQNLSTWIEIHLGDITPLSARTIAQKVHAEFE